ncbi:MAG: universal stress protein [Desulfohalobiaceae bacterium]
MTWLKKDNVVVPVDFSEFSYSAINIATKFVDTNSNIHIIHVVRETNPRTLSKGLGEKYKEYIDERQKVTESEIKSEIATEFPGINIHVKEGEPGEGIANFASKVNAELIIIPSYGRKGFKEHMLGSVAERVIRLAPCSVLVIKPHGEQGK